MTSARTAALLFAAVVLLYLPSLRNGFVYDDHEVILAQAPARSLRDVARVFAEPHGLPQSQLPYYRPTTRASLLLQKTWTGDAPAPFHLFNALLMGAVAIAAWWLVRQPRFGMSAAAAAWVAFAFAIHPVASECVYPAASGRETAMPALFFLASLAAWVRGGRCGRSLAALGYAAALWSKESSIAVPALAAVADLLRLTPDAPGRRARAWLARYAPFAAVTAAYLAVRSAVLPGWTHDARDSSVLFSAIAHNPWGPAESFLYFLQMVFAPSAWLAYEPSLGAWLRPLRAAVAIAGFVGVAAIALAVRDEEQSAPSRRASAFWLAWIPLGMVLHLNLLPLEVAFAERYLFVSSLGAIALLSTAVRRTAARFGAPRVATILGVASVLGLGAITCERGRYYSDELAFSRQWVASNPKHGNAHASLGAALARADRIDEAIATLREAVRLEPRLSAAHYNLGVVLARSGARGEAIAAFRATIAAWPGDADAHYALGVLLAQRGDRAEAATALREAIRLRPGFADAVTALRRVE